MTDLIDFGCMECGKSFKTVQAAERASTNGCPKCGGVDIDYLLVDDPEAKTFSENLAKKTILNPPVININMDFVMAGRAIFTVDNGKGTHYTYKVTKADPNPNYPQAWFITLLTGSDNTIDYTYMGVLDWIGRKTSNLRYFCRLTTKAGYTMESIPVKVFDWTMDVLGGWRDLPSGYSIRHKDLCGKCGRQLTDPLSLKLGIGPVCRGINKGEVT